MEAKGTGIGIATCKTALGWVGIAWSVRGLVRLTLPQLSEDEALARLPVSGISTGDVPGADPVAGIDVAALVDKLHRYFQGQTVEFDEHLDPSIGTDFQKRIWAITRAIPPGQTRTYGDIAREAGKPGAARAVGQSMARNPWPIIVPCHRVVGYDGQLTGFAGGLEMKHRMLTLEGAGT